MRVEVPDWRIVSDDLWERVQDQIEFVNERFGKRRVGGFSRTEQSKKYLFSGFLKCGLCGANMIVVSGNAYGSGYECQTCGGGFDTGG